MAPVIRAFLARGHEPLILAHGLSRDCYRRWGFPFRPLEEVLGPPPVSVAAFSDFLAGEAIETVFCTTSSSQVDLSNANLIIAARGLGIPTLAAFDHWKGFDRFGEGNETTFAPDRLLCIDEPTRARLAEAGFAPSVVHAVGHPYLESLQVNRKAPAKGRLKVLLVSQPVMNGGALRSIFGLGIGDATLMEAVAAALPPGIADVSCRFHPKETPFGPLPEGIERDESADWEEAMETHDAFIGVDSMALVEAALSGRPCIRLALPELRHVSDAAIPFPFGSAIEDMHDLTKAGNLLRSPAAIPGVNYAGSTERALAVLETFITTHGP